MKTKLNCLWTIQYYYEPGCPQLKVTMPNQVKAANFEEATAKVAAFLADADLGGKVRVNGILLYGPAILE